MIGLAGAMAACALAGEAMNRIGEPRPGLDEAGPVPMAVSALVAAMAGGTAWLWSRGAPEATFGRKHAALTVAAIWIGTGIFGALPFVFDAGMSPADAIFETVSGFTTTGATVVPSIETQLSRTLLLWRSLTQWLGGMGIVVLFVAVMPNLGVGAKHLFRNEVPGPTADSLQPRIAETGQVLWAIYAGFTLVLIALLWLAGMGPFEAVCHALTCMATGGFSTRDASIGAFQSPLIEGVLTVGMLLAGVNFGLYYALWVSRSWRGVWQSSELRAYAWIVGLSTLAITAGIASAHGGSWLQGFRYASFMVATSITSTGYGSEVISYNFDYPPASLALIVFLMFFGGMTGSTAGGLKIARVALLSKMAMAHLRRSLRPSVVQVVRMSRKPVPDSVLNEVAAFTAVYFGFLALGILVISAVEGAPVPTAFGVMLTSLSNMGPAPFHLEVDNFAGWTDFTKLFTALSMILGRLEFFTLLVMLLPEFWRRG